MDALWNAQYGFAPALALALLHALWQDTLLALGAALAMAALHRRSAALRRMLPNAGTVTRTIIATTATTTRSSMRE